MTYISRAFWSTLRSRASGTYIYRGFAAACAASGKEKLDKAVAGRSRRSSASSFVEEKKTATVRKSFESRDRDSEPTEKAKQSLVEEKVAGIADQQDQDTSALEEENAPLVRCGPNYADDRSPRTMTTRLVRILSSSYTESVNNSPHNTRHTTLYTPGISYGRCYGKSKRFVELMAGNNPQIPPYPR
jgi:hypothetical protein